LDPKKETINRRIAASAKDTMARPCHLQKTTSTQPSTWRRASSAPMSEVLAVQSEFAKSQMAAMQTQAKELGTVAQDIITSATRK
jgi:hypothetical protein